MREGGNAYPILCQLCVCPRQFSCLADCSQLVLQDISYSSPVPEHSSREYETRAPIFEPGHSPATAPAAADVPAGRLPAEAGRRASAADSECRVPLINRDWRRLGQHAGRLAAQCHWHAAAVTVVKLMGQHQPQAARLPGAQAIATT